MIIVLNIPIICSRSLIWRFMLSCWLIVAGAFFCSWPVLSWVNAWLEHWMILSHRVNRLFSSRLSFAIIPIKPALSLFWPWVRDESIDQKWPNIWRSRKCMITALLSRLCIWHNEFKPIFFFYQESGMLRYADFFFLLIKIKKFFYYGNLFFRRSDSSIKNVSE